MNIAMFAVGVCVGVTTMLLLERIKEERMKRMFARMVADGSIKNFRKYVAEMEEQAMKEGDE
ncbi:MAG: hypothetical protein MJZ81_07835 [Bacteroidales bacterium]|nr:hypothetical protein [Bacteroidales bacterium]